jgi:hypothetical protein
LAFDFGVRAFRVLCTRLSFDSFLETLIDLFAATAAAAIRLQTKTQTHTHHKTGH